MSLNKPPIIKARRSKLNGSDFSSGLNRNSTETYFQPSDSFLNHEYDEETQYEKNQFDNFFNSKLKDSMSDLNNTSQFNSEFIGTSQQTQSTLNFNLHNAMHRRKQATNNSRDDSLNTTKRPPITPRKSLHKEEAHQIHLNENENNNNTNYGSNPFIVKNIKTNGFSNNHSTFYENDLNKSFIDYDSHKILRSVFNYENKSVDLELDQSSIKIKPTNGDFGFYRTSLKF